MIKVRDFTPEERIAYNKAIKSLSTPTGYNILTGFVIDKDKLVEGLYDHLGFNGKDGTYIYCLTRVKEAFGYGTMALDDFVEVDGDFVGELADFLIEFVKKKSR
jgi:hypothetical protein